MYVKYFVVVVSLSTLYAAFHSVLTTTLCVTYSAYPHCTDGNLRLEVLNGLLIVTQLESS